MPKTQTADEAGPFAAAQSPFTLIQKLGRVMKKVSTIPKRGENAFHHYKYVLEADVSDAVREAFAEEGIIIFPHLEGYEVRETAKGGLITFTTYRFDVTDGEYTLPLKVVSAGHDTPGDKGPFKALTGALKYALLKLLLIPTGDDPERDDANPEPPQSQARKNIEAAKEILGATEDKPTLTERKNTAVAGLVKIIAKNRKDGAAPAKAVLEWLSDILERPLTSLTLKDERELEVLEQYVKDTLPTLKEE